MGITSTHSGTTVDSAMIQRKYYINCCLPYSPGGVRQLCALTQLPFSQKFPLSVPLLHVDCTGK